MGEKRISSSHLYNVILYDNVIDERGDSMDELQQRQKIISQLVETRLEQGISQAELARRVGTQRSNICRLESGVQNPTLDMILKIASALGKDVSLLLYDNEEPMSNIYSLRI